ncbi:enoyl-CoA hydratase/carnithine racemase [gamma proteobacterium NOR5-3]|nr:enoyl-CoA hydratase/carnithine racemase [gamma proteobacterium NOR5-3]
MPELVTISEEESYVMLTMDDGKANALSFAMFEALNAGLDAAEATGKVVIIAGRPGKFSAGFDLSVMGGGGDAMVKLLRQGAELSQRLLSFGVPVVLAVSGHALAMGALLCLSADYRVGMKGNYKLGLNEVAIGMTLPWFGIELARARLEETQLNHAVGLAHIYAPEGAVSVGYLDEVIEEEQLLARAAELAAGFAALNMPAHKGTKARIREPLMLRLEEALRRDFEAGDAAIAAAS